MLNFSELSRKRILDIGAGDGSFVQELRALRLDAIGVDIHLTPEQRLQSHFFEADALTLPFADQSIDVIYSTYSIVSTMYAPASDAGLTACLLEFKRVLRTGGKMRLAPVEVERFPRVASQIPGLKVTRAENLSSYSQSITIEIQRIA